MKVATHTTATINPLDAQSQQLALVRLMQLISPALPIGAFTYSQGLEWAVEVGWVSNEQQTHEWISTQLTQTQQYIDLPVLARLYRALEAGSRHDFAHWSSYLLACRETQELRLEETQRGRAMHCLLEELLPHTDPLWKAPLSCTQAAGFAYACHHWQINEQHTLLGFAWGWLENQVAAAIKLVPLGQTAGQRLQLSLGQSLPNVVEAAQLLDDDSLGASNPAVSMASALHENQYTRLFRS